jgi:hypothetical protein
MELVKNLPFIKKVKEESIDGNDEEIISSLKQAVKEVNLISEGKLQARPLTELLNEL